MRVRVVSTGRSVFRASRALWAWTLRSSLAPNAPPFWTCVTRTRVLRHAEERGHLLAVGPHALALRVDVHQDVRVVGGVGHGQ